MSGCADASSDPTAVLVAPETRGALALAEALPTPEELGARFPEASSRLLFERLPADEARRLVGDLAKALDAAEALRSGEPALPQELLGALGRARELHHRASRALGSGRIGEGTRLALESAQVLRTLTPEHVAGELVRRAEEGIRRTGADATYTEADQRRARRLARNAREAMSRGDWARAIRRAYYACRLLGVPVD